MVTRKSLLVSAVLLLSVPLTASSHPGHSGPEPTPAPKRYGFGSSEPAKPRPPEPYRGQKVCPVSGEPLGSHGEPVKVDIPMTTMGKPTFLEKIGLKKQQPQTVKMDIYVCCPECAAKVQADPNPSSYLVRVIAEKSGVPSVTTPAATTAHGH